MNVASVNREEWIRANTDGCGTVVELGAGQFEQLAHVHPSVANKAGIEVYRPYIDAALFHDCQKIEGDIRDFFNLMVANGLEFDCALMVDIIEHFEKDEGVRLLWEVVDSFRTVLLMIPEGNHPQTEDKLGFGGHEWQTHRSTWYGTDVEAIGFDVVRDPDFYHLPGKDSGGLFCVYR